ncbi:MAG TPA: FGGY family carbohydrate kinase [Terriglobales bacterium]|nr:FGGY family carbohydrate kinase [Terriglobales bacterium]
MTESLFIGIDLGTQSVRALAANLQGDVVASASAPLTSMRDGVRHEQDPLQWWKATVICCRSVIQQLHQQSGKAFNIEGIAVDSTSGTILIVDDQRRPLTNGLMYDDGRAKDEAVRVNEIGASLWSQLSYRMQPSWALPKLLWLIRNNIFPASAKLLHQNDFINAQLAGHILASDSSHTLKTGFDLVRSSWPSSIFDQLDISTDLLPDVVGPGTMIGSICQSSADETGLPAGTPIFAGMTDGCAAQIASGATKPGNWNSVLGTTLVLKGVTKYLLRDPLGVMYSHRSPDSFWLPGGASSTGAGVLTAELKDADLDALSRAVENASPSSLVIYPLAGHGERFPFAAPEAHSFAVGPKAGAIPDADRYLALLQGVAFIEKLSFDYARYLGADLGGTISISGGATRSKAWNQIRSNVLQRELTIPQVTEPAFGMCILAAAHRSSLREATTAMVHSSESVTPNRDFSEYAGSYGTLITELVKRGWLPENVGKFSLEGAFA